MRLIDPELTRLSRLAGDNESPRETSDLAKYRSNVNDSAPSVIFHANVNGLSAEIVGFGLFIPGAVNSILNGFRVIVTGSDTDFNPKSLMATTVNIWLPTLLSLNIKE